MPDGSPLVTGPARPRGECGRHVRIRLRYRIL